MFPLLIFYLKRRANDFFIIIYNLVLPAFFITALGYLMAPSYKGGIITSFQYYTIVLIPFFTGLSITTSLYNAKEDRREKVSNRIITAQVNVSKLIFAKILSSFIVLFVLTAFLIITGAFFSKNVSAINLLTILTLNGLFTLFCTCLGYFLGFSNNHEDVIRNYLSLPTCILAFLGSCFMPISSTNPIILSITRISPFYWINKANFALLFDSNYVLVLTISIILLIFSVLLTILTVTTFKVEAYL